MRPDDIIRVLRRRPFEPFRLNITDGTISEIRHPESAIVDRSTVTLGLPVANQPEFVAVVMISLLHITRLELLSPTELMPAS